MSRIYRDGFEMMGRQEKWAPVVLKKNKTTGQIVQHVGAIDVTPLTYKENHYIALASELMLIGQLLDNELTGVGLSATVKGAIQKLTDTMDTSKSTNLELLKNYNRAFLRQNKNLLFATGGLGSSSIDLEKACSDLTENWENFANQSYEGDQQTFTHWKKNLISNTVDSIRYKKLTKEFVRLILGKIIELCNNNGAFDLEDLEDAKFAVDGRRKRRSRSRSRRSRRSKSKSVDGKKRRSKKSKKSKKSKRSRRSRRSKSKSKSVDGRKRRSRRSKKSKRSRRSKSKSKSVDGRKRRSRRSKKSKRSRRSKSKSKSVDGRKRRSKRSKKSKRSRRRRRHSVVDGRKRRSRSRSRSRSRRSRSRSMSAKKLLKLLRKM
jgi:hypothetical protein